MKRGESDAVRKRRTGDRSESRFQWPLGVHSYVKRERGGPPTETRRGIDARPKDDKSFFRLIVLPPFESFDLASIAVTRTRHVILTCFPFSQNFGFARSLASSILRINSEHSSA